MIARLIARLRERIAVEDPDERIEGSGDPITSPQHRRAADAERMLEESAELTETQRKFDRDR
ncbi:MULTISPECIES: hypothetical protein [Haloterrigena]|uniref:Uncharacterized protein n=2 Tax=Haloterrigena TaxID=121871 RepID=M0BQ85_9EURY|nr:MULTISPECIES: hypothetical protein [Haloterrigena]ELZ13081.1 hypothetical protein C477_21515 [Haloterrigena salina JCM 13891]QRV15734.1 hypothetical protein JMJ58_02185 [Haloterrigena salifodinae]